MSQNGYIHTHCHENLRSHNIGEISATAKDGNSAIGMSDTRQIKLLLRIYVPLLQMPATKMDMQKLSIYILKTYRK
jgi:hypothetical protein